jgi:hypothetical protein
VISHRGAAADEHLHDVRLDRERAGADQMVVGGHLAPAEQVLAFLLDDRVQESAHDIPLLGVTRQEDESAAIVLGRRQGNAQAAALATKELVRNLYQDAGAVAGVRLAAARPAVEKIDEDRERLPNDRVRATAFDVHDKADAARIVLVCRVVETLSGWWSGHGWSALRISHLHPLCENSFTILQAIPLLVIPKKLDNKYQKLL